MRVKVTLGSILKGGPFLSKMPLFDMGRACWGGEGLFCISHLNLKFAQRLLLLLAIPHLQLQPFTY